MASETRKRKDMDDETPAIVVEQQIVPGPEMITVIMPMDTPIVRDPYRTRKVFEKIEDFELVLFKKKPGEEERPIRIVRATAPRAHLIKPTVWVKMI